MSEHKYTLHEAEIKFKIIANKEEGESFSDAFKKIRDKLSETEGYCPCKIDHNEDTKCICRQFRETMEEGICECGLYSKILRTEEEEESFLKEPNFSTQRTGRKPKSQVKEDQDRYTEESDQYLVKDED